MKYFLIFMSLVSNAWAIQIGPEAKVSFVFHDALASTYTKAAPILAKYGAVGTAHILTGCVGMTTIPNSCKASNNRKYMTWTQIQNLYKTYGWEIGSHTETHPLLVSADPVDQPNKISMDQVKNELLNSKQILTSLGFEVLSFAPPYGDYNQGVIAEIAKSYTTMQGFWDTGYNQFPYDGMLVRNQQVQGGVTVAKVKEYIDSAIANKEWLTLTFHEIKDKASGAANAYETSSADLEAMVAYAKGKNIKIVTMTEGYNPSNPNLVVGGDFTTGITEGWTTRAPSAVTLNTYNNGIYPSRKNSVRFISQTYNIHLFSPKIKVELGKKYLLKTFVNITKLSSGELFFYIDEYNSDGDWISGKYIKGIKAPETKYEKMEYSPSSSNVSDVSIQIGVTANPGITAFVDNISFSLMDKNLMPNGGFDSGLSEGWRTNNEDVVSLDLANNGSFPEAGKSIKLVGSTEKDYHLFSPNVAVDSNTSYLIRAYANLSDFRSGEIYFYVDEYDANGNWINGKYFQGLRASQAKVVSLIYTPSSANVASASLQIGVQVNSDLTAFIDNVEWFALK